MAMNITVKIIVEDEYADQEEIKMNGECAEETWEEDIYTTLKVIAPAPYF